MSLSRDHLLAKSAECSNSAIHVATAAPPPSYQGAYRQSMLGGDMLHAMLLDNMVF